MRWLDRWLEKLPWMSVQRHHREVTALSAEHAVQLKEAVRQAKEDSFESGKVEGDAEGYNRGIKAGRLLEREEREEASVSKPNVRLFADARKQRSVRAGW